MINFLKRIKNSVYSPEFYATLAKSPLKSAIGYFLLLALVLALIQTLFSAPGLLINLPREANTFLNDAVNKFPADLEVSVKNGQVSTTAKQPYFLKDDSGKNILVIDTQTPYSASQFDKYAAGVWLTQDSVFYRDSGYSKDTNTGGIKTQSLSQFPDTTVNREAVAALAGKVSPYVKYLGPGALILVLLFSYLLVTSRLIYLFVLAVGILILTKIMKKGLSYWQAYKVGLYAVTLGLGIDLVKSLIGWNGFPFMFTLIALIVVFVNFRGIKP